MDERSGAGAELASLQRFAWAKVNLYLQVTGRRHDGFHLLDSLIVFVGIGDRLTIEPDDRLGLDVEGRFADAVPSGPDNLVLQAGTALQQAAGVSRGARIRLEKNLPAAAGLGGGSADAAAALDGLRELWALAEADLPLADIALGLGADVPVCAYGRPAFVTGIGEEIGRAPPLPLTWLVLVNPGVPLSTPSVFAARSGNFSQACPWQDVVASPVELAERLGERSNDLEPAARQLAPVVGRVIERIAACPGCLLSRMSGSGASCFGLFAERAQAAAACEEIAASEPGWWVDYGPLLHGRLDRHWRSA